jgi:hypothetical protein
MKLDSDGHFKVAAQHFLNASNLKSTDLHGYDRQMADGLEVFVEGTRRALQQILDQLEAQKPKVSAGKAPAGKAAGKAPAGKAPAGKGKK